MFRFVVPMCDIWCDGFSPETGGIDSIVACIALACVCVLSVCLWINSRHFAHQIQSISISARGSTHTQSLRTDEETSSELRRKRMKRKKKTRRQTRLLLNSSRIRCGKFTYDRPAAGRFTFILFFFFLVRQKNLQTQTTHNSFNEHEKVTTKNINEKSNVSAWYACNARMFYVTDH